MSLDHLGSTARFDAAWLRATLVVDGLATIGDERAPRPSLARDVFGGAISGPI